jgi:hypothetical protein
MACAITKGRSLPCKNSVGGLKAIYILDYSSTVANLTDTAGTITLPTDDASVQFFKFDIKGSSSLETSVTSSRENGTTFYETTLNVTFTYLDVATQEEIKLLNAGRAHYVVEDYNGNYFLIGKEHGAEITGGTIVTGAAMGDLSGFTLVATAQETAPPFFATAPTVDTTTPIDPDA